jgi:PST family polysaccharide transporter
MLRFGVHVTGFEFVNYFSRNLDNMLIGRYIGPAALGLYAKAYQLFMLPITQIRSPVTQVGLPVLSSLRSEPIRYVRYYQRLTDVLATLIVPLTTFVFIEAGFLIRVALGPQWMGAVPLFRILAVAGLVQGVASTRGLVLLSHGYSARYLRWGTANAVCMIVAFVAGLRFGVNGVAAAYAIANYAILVPSLFYCFHDTPVTVALFFKTLVLPFVFSASAASVALLARHLLGGESVAANLGACAVFVSAYVALSSLRPIVRDTMARIIAGLSVDRVGQIAEGEEVR